MTKTLKTILILSVAFFEMWVLSLISVKAQPLPDLVVQFETAPLFYETDFLPGDSVVRWVKVTNNGSQTQRIATEAINVSDPDNLSDFLNLVIKEGSETLYDDSLSDFWNDGEVYLSDLAGNGSQTQYDFTISFDSSTGNPFQGKTLGFDILIGFQGTNGALFYTAGGGGGFLPSGLTILDESVRITTTTETQVTIVWTTSYPATSQVVYGRDGEKHLLDLNDNSGTPPKYGYENTTPEHDISPKVMSHSFTISGLIPDTKYYFRAVSHGSFAISQESSFETLKPKTEEIEEIFGAEITEKEENQEIGFSGIINKISEKIFEEIIPSLSQIPSVLSTDEEKPVVSKEKFISFEEEEKDLAKMPASLINIAGKLSISVLIISMIIFLAFLAGNKLKNKKKKKRGRKKKKVK